MTTAPTRLEIYLGEHGERDWLPRLLSIEQSAVEVGMRPERLRELADAHYMPHARIDNGPPLFYKPDLQRWIRTHLVNLVNGKPLSDAVIVYLPPEPATTSQIPEPLMAYRDELKVMVPEPAFPCVYFLILNREIVYVGQTINLAKRLQEHRAAGKEFDRALYLLVPEHELLSRESQFIKALRPRLNRGCVADGPANSIDGSPR